MRWFGREESGNVEDRRGLGGTGLAVGGVGGLVLVALSFFFGVDLTHLGGPSAQISDNSQRTQQASPAEDRLASFTKVVFRDTELVWQDRFSRLGRRYTEPKLVLYNDAVQSACGNARAAVGPFYCSGDRKVYIDLTFYRDMERTLHSPGEFARAYVIAHEVGHHVQRLLGYHAGREQSVQTELQADFLAGVWAHDAQEKFHYLDKGDVDSALHAAFEIGDDRLQKRARGYVVPDSFTHGTSAQRTEAFTRGFETGDLNLASEYLPQDRESAYSR